MTIRLPARIHVPGSTYGYLTAIPCGRPRVMVTLRSGERCPLY